MRLSTKTRYGVRAMFDIAFHSSGRPDAASQAKEIARREGIPLRYLEQIFQDLKRAGLVESKRGPRGGYSLKRSAADIPLSAVVRALQGPIEDMFVGDRDAGASAGDGQASTRDLTAALWRELAEHVSAWFDSVTLADLIKRGEELGLARAGSGQPMYFI